MTVPKISPPNPVFSETIEPINPIGFAGAWNDIWELWEKGHRIRFLGRRTSQIRSSGDRKIDEYRWTGFSDEEDFRVSIVLERTRVL